MRRLSKSTKPFMCYDVLKNIFSRNTTYTTLVGNFNKEVLKKTQYEI